MNTKVSWSAAYLCAFSLLTNAGCSDAGVEVTTNGDGAGGTWGAVGGAPPAAGGQAPASGGGVGTGGDSVTPAGGAPGSGGAVQTPSGGASATGGAEPGAGGTSAASGGSEVGSGGSATASGGSSGSCEVIGWATRDGRDGGEVEVTGGGTTAPLVVNSFSALQEAASGDAPRVIHISGTVGSGWSGRSGDRLSVGSNKTIVGLASGTELKAPILVKGSTNVIIRNLVIHGPGSNADQAWDNINIEASKNVWIDHCEFWDGQDGNADVVKGADNVTFTWNIFGYRTGGEHNFSNLVASSDDEPESVNKLNITLMFNWFTGVAQRQPRCRYGDIHVVNNLFSRDGQVSDYGISAGKDCRILTEANHFIEINTPIYTSHASGSAANEVRADNIFENTSGNETGFGTAFNPPYEYKDRLVPAAQVKGLVSEKAGATLSSPADCD
jgi:pectate lyase